MYHMLHSDNKVSQRKEDVIKRITQKKKYICSSYWKHSVSKFKPLLFKSQLIQSNELLRIRAESVSPGLSPKAQGPGAPMARGRGMWLSQLKPTEPVYLCPPFCSIKPSADWVMPTGIGVGIFSTQSTDSDANLSQKHPHRHTQRPCSLATWAPLAQTSQHVNNHSSYVIQNRAQMCMQKSLKTYYK